MVELLLAARADATIVAGDGETARSIAREAARRQHGSNPRKAVVLLEAHAAAPAAAAADADLSELPVSPAELVGLIRRGQLGRLKQLLARPAVCAILDLPAGKAGDIVDGRADVGGRTPLVAACTLKSTFSLETVRGAGAERTPHPFRSGRAWANACPLTLLVCGWQPHPTSSPN